MRVKGFMAHTPGAVVGEAKQMSDAQWHVTDFMKGFSAGTPGAVVKQAKVGF